MFTVEVRINGSLIAHISGHNKEELMDGSCAYSYELYEVESKRISTGSVNHSRQDGILPLVAKILDASSPPEKVKKK